MAMVTSSGVLFDHHVWVTAIVVKAGAEDINAKFYDHASAASGDVEIEIQVPPGRTKSVGFGHPGRRFHKGLYVAITGSGGRVSAETW